MSKPITRTADVRDMDLLKTLLRDLYEHNGSRLVIELYQARTGQTLAQPFVCNQARRMRLHVTPAARAAAVKQAGHRRLKPAVTKPAFDDLGRQFLRHPAPPDLVGQRYYGQ